MKTFIIIGLNPQGLSMLRLLSRAGHHVIAFSDSKTAVGFFSKYGDKRLFSTIEELKKQISDLAESSDEKLTCIITSGVLLAWIVSDYPELYELCNVQSGPLPLIKLLAHKNLMYDFASSKGLKCARFVLLSDYRPGALQFPVILKRNYEIHLFFKVKKLNSEAEFREFVKKIDKKDYQNIIVQEFITLENFLNVSYQGYFIDGEAGCVFISDQQRRLSSGITSFIKEIRDKEILEITNKAADAFYKGSGYTGFSELEFLYSIPDKTLYFIEINTRTCGLHSVLVKKYPNLAGLYNEPGNFPAMIENTEQIQWINIARDIRARFQSRDLKHLSQFFTSYYDILDRHDLKPFIYQFLWRI